MTEATSAEDHYYAGIDFFGEGKLDEAIAEYERAIGSIRNLRTRCMVWRKHTTRRKILTGRSRRRGGFWRSSQRIFWHGRLCRARISARAWCRKRKRPGTRRACWVGRRSCGSRKRRAARDLDRAGANVWHQDKSVFDWVNLPAGAREDCYGTACMMRNCHLYAQIYLSAR